MFSPLWPWLLHLPLWALGLWWTYHAVHDVLRDIQTLRQLVRRR